MPIYEYGCTVCGETFEAYKRLSEEKERELCPKCGGEAKKAALSLFRTSSTTGRGGGKGGCAGAGGRSPFR